MDGIPAVWLDSCCPLFFSLAIPIGVAQVAGGSGCFCLHMGVPCSLTSTRFFFFFYALIALQGSLPDIK